MNPTVRLLRMIGSPFIPTAEGHLDADEASELYTCAVKNRISLLYLETLKKQGALGELEADYEKRYARYQRFINVAVKASKFLDSLNVDHVILKTIRPFTAAPSDIDVLCLGSDTNYNKAVEAMFKAGYVRVPTGPPVRQIKLYHPEEGIWIDLHKEMGASRITCVDKRKLNKHVTEMKLPNGGVIKALTPPADLAIVMLHSVITEQLYSLAEYYTTIYRLPEMDAEEINSLIAIVRENHMVFAAKVHIGITTALHRTVYGMVPEKLAKLSAKLGGETSETRRLTENALKMPHRYHPLTLARALLEKMKERETRKCIVPQMMMMLNSDFRRAFIWELKDHFTREAQSEQF